MSDTFPKTKDWSGDRRKCSDCQQYCPTSAHFNDEIHGGRALMDTEVPSMFHSYACVNKLLPEQITANRHKWSVNSQNFGLVYRRLTELGMVKPSKETVIKEIKKSGMVYFDPHKDFDRSKPNKWTKLEIEGVGEVPVAQNFMEWSDVTIFGNDTVEEILQNLESIETWCENVRELLKQKVNRDEIRQQVNKLS